MEGLRTSLDLKERDFILMQCFAILARMKTCTSSGSGYVIGTSRCLYFEVDLYFLRISILGGSYFSLCPVKGYAVFNWGFSLAGKLSLVHIWHYE